MLRRRKREATRWEQDNKLALNPAAFLAVGLLAGALVGLALLLWLL